MQSWGLGFHVAFLVKYGTFVRYIPNKLHTFLGPQNAYFSAKFSHCTAIQAPSRYLAGCLQSIQNKSGLLATKIGQDMASNVNAKFTSDCLDKMQIYA